MRFGAAPGISYRIRRRPLRGSHRPYLSPVIEQSLVTSVYADLEAVADRAVLNSKTGNAENLYLCSLFQTISTQSIHTHLSVFVFGHNVGHNGGGGSNGGLDITSLVLWFKNGGYLSTLSMYIVC